MTFAEMRRACEPTLRKLFHLYWRFARGMTLGVRAMVIDAQDRVFLIRHTYVAGWHLPGGGVEVGQTLEAALRRELMEEGLIAVIGAPSLHGVFLNDHVSQRDHVAIYIVRQFTQDRMPEPNSEIAECGFFSRDALPAETTVGTRLRLAEVFDGAPLRATWR